MRALIGCCLWVCGCAHTASTTSTEQASQTALSVSEIVVDVLLGLFAH